MASCFSSHISISKVNVKKFKTYSNMMELSTFVYGKQTHTDSYLNFKSHHHPRIKAGIVEWLAHRARECATKIRFSQNSTIYSRYLKNDYPAQRCLKKTMKSVEVTETETSQEKPRFAFSCMFRQLRQLHQQPLPLHSPTTQSLRRGQEVTEH